MTTENTSWSNLHERMLPTRRGSNQQLPPDHQSDAHPTEPPRPAGTKRKFRHMRPMTDWSGLRVRSLIRICNLGYPRMQSFMRPTKTDQTERMRRLFVRWAHMSGGTFSHIGWHIYSQSVWGIKAEGSTAIWSQTARKTIVYVFRNSVAALRSTTADITRMVITIL